MNDIRSFFNRTIGSFQGWQLSPTFGKGPPQPHHMVAVFGEGDQSSHFAECAVRNFLSEENGASFTSDELVYLQAAQDSYQEALGKLESLPRIKSAEELRSERLNASGYPDFLGKIVEGLTNK